jgi:hypothetical protein
MTSVLPDSVLLPLDPVLLNVSIFCEMASQFDLFDHREQKSKEKLSGLSPRTNYTDRATAASRRSWGQLED